MTAAYLQNLTSSRVIDKTPLKLFTGEKPDLSHLRLSGFKVYSLVPSQKRKEWDDKAAQGVSVGYGYRILVPKRKVIILLSVIIFKSKGLTKIGVQSLSSRIGSFCGVVCAEVRGEFVGVRVRVFSKSTSHSGSTLSSWLGGGVSSEGGNSHRCT